MAMREGITEETIEKLLKEQNVNDFYIENIKTRLGIVEKKPERVRKTVAIKKNEGVEEIKEQDIQRPVTTIIENGQT